MFLFPAWALSMQQLAAWSSKLLMANAGALLNVLHAPRGCEPASRGLVYVS